MKKPLLLALCTFAVAFATEQEECAINSQSGTELEAYCAESQTLAKIKGGSPLTNSSNLLNLVARIQSESCHLIVFPTVRATLNGSSTVLEIKRRSKHQECYAGYYIQ